MATVEKPAGAVGTYVYTLSQAPAAAPTRTIFSNAGRSVVAGAAAVMAATGSPTAFTGTYALGLAAGRYYLRHVFTTAGGATVTDDDDELLLVVASGTVASAHASLSDVEARYGALTAAQQSLAEALLGDAAAILAAHLPTLDARIAAGSLPLRLVVQVESAMVIRVLRNPEAMKSETIGVYSYTRDQALSAGLLYALVDELALLASRTGRLSVGTIRLGCPYSR
jgi:hypothetical protein